MRYRLSTLLIVLALLPPLLAVGWWMYLARQAERRAAIEQELRAVEAALVRIKARNGPQLDADVREVAIVQLEEQAAVLEGRRGSAALEDLLKRLREVSRTKPNP